MPPARLATAGNPPASGSITAWAERLPARHTATTGRSRVELADARRQAAQGNQDRAGDVARGTGELVGLAHVEDLHRALMLLEHLRLRSPIVPAKVKVSGAQPGSAPAAGSLRRAGRICRLAGTALVDLLGMRELEIGHVADEVAEPDLAAEPRIEAPLLGDRR